MRISDWSSVVCSSDLDANLYPCGHAAEGKGTGQRRRSGNSPRQAPPRRRTTRLARSPLIMPHRRMAGTQNSVDLKGHAAYFGERHNGKVRARSEEHTCELLSSIRISCAVFCVNRDKVRTKRTNTMYE